MEYERKIIWNKKGKILFIELVERTMIMLPMLRRSNISSFTAMLNCAGYHGQAYPQASSGPSSQLSQNAQFPHRLRLLCRPRSNWGRVTEVRLSGEVRSCVGLASSLWGCSNMGLKWDWLNTSKGKGKNMCNNKNHRNISLKLNTTKFVRYSQRLD